MFNRAFQNNHNVNGRDCGKRGMLYQRRIKQKKKSCVVEDEQEKVP